MEALFQDKFPTSEANNVTHAPRKMDHIYPVGEKEMDVDNIGSS